MDKREANAKIAEMVLDVGKLLGEVSVRQLENSTTIKDIVEEMSVLKEASLIVHTLNQKNMEDKAQAMTDVMKSIVVAGVNRAFALGRESQEKP